MKILDHHLPLRSDLKSNLSLNFKSSLSLNVRSNLMYNQCIDSELHVSLTTHFSYQQDCSLIFFTHSEQAEDVKIRKLQL